MENLFKIGGGLMWAVLGKLADKLPAELADDLNRNPKMIDAMVKAAIEYKFKNPYEQPIELQLNALRLANDEEKWGISEDDFARLKATAPAWPKGKHAYRSFRIRFGEGNEGVALTFEAHITRIKSVFGQNGVTLWGRLPSGPVLYKGKPVNRLRLLSGNFTHKPVIEWIVADLDTHRKRESVTAVRDANSLADELLVVAWLFPEMIRDIAQGKLPGFFAAGYEVNFPDYDAEAWQRVMLVGSHGRQVHVNACGPGDADSGFSVPRLRESPAPST